MGRHRNPEVVRQRPKSEVSLFRTTEAYSELAQEELKLMKSSDHCPNPISKSSSSNEEMVAIRLKDLCPILGDAMKQNRAFLKDFADDRVHITKDVYEILIAFRRCGMGEAA